MIRMIFSYNRELMQFLVNGKSIYYKDKVWGKWIRCLPEPVNLKAKLSAVKNETLKNLFTFSEAEIQEWNDANTEDEVAEIVERDCCAKGCFLIKRIDKASGSAPEGETWLG